MPNQPEFERGTRNFGENFNEPAATKVINAGISWQRGRHTQTLTSGFEKRTDTIKSHCHIEAPFQGRERVCPTSEAKGLYDRIYPVLSYIDRRLNAVTASVGLRKHRRQVRIQAVSGLMPFLVRTIGAFREMHEDYDFDVCFLSAPPKDETLDADIGIWADTKQSSFLDYRDLRLIPSWLCASLDFLRLHPVKTIDDLDRVPLLGCTSWVCPFTLTGLCV